MFKLLSLILFSFVSCDLEDLSPDLLIKFKNDIKARMDAFNRPDIEGVTIDGPVLFPTLVRLVFHDCAGKHGCNGCIDPTDIDHSGLEYGAILPIEQVYQNEINITLPLTGSKTNENFYLYSSIGKTIDNWNGNPSKIIWKNYMSRTDIWILSATYGFEIGVNISSQVTKDPNFPLPPSITNYNNVCINKTTGKGVDKSKLQYFNNIECIKIPYKINRPECESSPWTLTNANDFNGNPDWNFKELIEFFFEKFGFNMNETVAIMGGHTLGRGHSFINRNIIDNYDNCCGGTGYRDHWKPGPASAFNNGYYFFMNVDPWIQRRANQPRTINPNDDPNYNDYSSLVQWMAVNPPFIGEIVSGFNTNIDMSLFLNISVGINGNVSCIHPKVYRDLNANPVRPVYSIYDGPRGTQCSRNMDVKTIFDLYVVDNNRFLYDFMKVWTKMINTFEHDDHANESNIFKFKFSIFFILFFILFL